MWLEESHTVWREAKKSDWHRAWAAPPWYSSAERQGHQEAGAPQPLSPTLLPGGEGTLCCADSSQPAWAPVPALQLTSCVILGGLCNHFLLCSLTCKMGIIIALPCKAFVRREDACITCLARCGHLDVCYSIVMGVIYYLCHLSSLQKEDYYEDSPLAHVS